MKPSPRQHQIAGHEGVRLCVWDYEGSGPPLLLAHCTGALARIWDPVVAALGGAFRVVAVDTRGQGDSEAPLDRAHYAWWRSGEDLLAVLDALGLGPATLACGHSAGGAHVAHAALARPGVFSRMVLIDPIIAPEGAFGEENPLAEKVRYRKNRFASRAEARERFRAKPPMSRWVPAALEAYLEHAFVEVAAGAVELKCPGDREAWFFELGGAPEIWERLPELAAPVLLLTGSESYLTGLVANQQERLPRAELHAVPGADHFVPQEQPEAVAEALRDFFC